MMKRKWFWGAAVIIGIGVVMGALFPAGRDPFVPWSSAVAVKGRNLFCMMERNNARHKAGKKWCDPQMCSNSVEFITGVLDVIGSEVQYGCVTNVGVTLWNIAVDVPEDFDDLFPCADFGQLQPKVSRTPVWR